MWFVTPPYCDRLPVEISNKIHLCNFFFPKIVTKQRGAIGQSVNYESESHYMCSSNPALSTGISYTQMLL